MMAGEGRGGASLWEPRIEASAGSKHRGIFNAIITDIAAGNLRAGDRMPPQRAVAAALGVDLTTVTKAYGRARAEGMLEATTGRGSFVSAGSPASAGWGRDLPLLDLSKNSPPRSPTLDIGRALVRELDSILSHDGSTMVLNYQDTGGSLANRAAGAAWLSRRISPAVADRIVLTSGAQSAIYAVCQLLCTTNKHVAVGQVSYPGIHTAAFQQGLRLVPLLMDGEGIVPASFDRVCREVSLAALYITPTVDNPTTATLSAGRREEIAAISERHAVPIIEDDPYGELLEEPLPPIAAFAPSTTWHLATLSKCLTPALRFGYALAPTIDGSRQLAATLQAMTMMASPMMAAAASRWIYSGFAAEMAAAIRTENMLRQAMAAEIFASADFAANPAAPHFWLSLPAPWRSIDFVHEAERRGVITLASASFAVTSPPLEAVRISLGGASSRDQLGIALKVLRDVIHDAEPNPTRAMV